MIYKQLEQWKANHGFKKVGLKDFSYKCKKEKYSNSTQERTYANFDHVSHSKFSTTQYEMQ